MRASSNCPTTRPLGAPFARVLGVDDPVIDIGLTPNRGDCAGVHGIARDLCAAGLGTLKRVPAWGERIDGRFESPIGVHIDLPGHAVNACPMFAGRLIRGVRNGPSPRWLQERLKAVGLRPISALVDITNYFTMDVARPLHVFDAGKLTGDITVRLARPGETIAALDGRTYALDGEMTVIADAAGPQALGGVMGGERPGCTETNHRRVHRIGTVRYPPHRPRPAESSASSPTRAIGSSAASTRLRPLPGARSRNADDPAALRRRAERGGHRRRRAGLAPHVRLPARARRGIGRRRRAARGVGGASCGASASRSRPTGDRLSVSPPAWRPDIQGEADLVEEVLRIRGYDEIPVGAAAAHDRPAPAGADAGADAGR